MGYQRIPVDTISVGGTVNGATASTVLYSDSSGNLATLSTFSYLAANGFLGLGTTTPTAMVHLSGALSSTAALGVGGVGICVAAQTITDTVGSGTITTAAVHSLGVPTLAASAAVTYTNSATLYIAGATVAGTNVTATNKYSLLIAGGNVKFGALDVVLDTTTGTKIGTGATQKLGFYGATPIVLPATTGTVTGYTSVGGSAVLSQSTFTGNSGSTAYTIGDIVLALKSLGLLTA